LQATIDCRQRAGEEEEPTSSALHVHRVDWSANDVAGMLIAAGASAMAATGVRDGLTTGADDSRDDAPPHVRDERISQRRGMAICKAESEAEAGVVDASMDLFPGYDLAVGCDVLYLPESAEHVLEAMTGALHFGGTALVFDCGRPAASAAIALLQGYLLGDGTVSIGAALEKVPLEGNSRPRSCSSSASGAMGK